MGKVAAHNFKEDFTRLLVHFLEIDSFKLNLVFGLQLALVLQHRFYLVKAFLYLLMQGVYSDLSVNYTQLLAQHLQTLTIRLD